MLRPLADDAELARPLCCGCTYLSLGQVDAAREEARRLHAALAPALASGAPIVGLEPSCILSLRDDHLKLGLGEDARQVARQVFLFEEFIAREHDRKRLRWQLKPWTQPPMLVHGHCHQKAVGAMKSLRKVLRLIRAASLSLSTPAVAAWPAVLAWTPSTPIFRAPWPSWICCRRCAAPDAPVLANGFSCRHQIEGCGRAPGILPSGWLRPWPRRSRCLSQPG